MIWIHRTIQLAPRPRGFHLVTHEILPQLPELSRVDVGLLHLFLLHTSASLAINENADPDVAADLESSLNSIVPEKFPYRHTIEGPDDMPAHIKGLLIGHSLSIPVHQARLCLGTWQGVFLAEHRNHGGSRKLVLTLQGSERSANS